METDNRRKMFALCVLSPTRSDSVSVSEYYFLAARVVRVRRRSVSILRMTRLRHVGVLEPWLVARELGVACHD